MSSTDGLTVQLSAEDDGLSAGLGSVTDLVARLEAQLQTLSGQPFGENITAGAAQASAGLQGTAVAAEGAGAALEDVTRYSGTAARGLNAMGLEAGGAAARVEGLLGVFEELQGAVPALLAIGAAFIAISAGFNFFKDGIQAAAEMQSQMETLRAAVEAQGGSWATASAAIQQWAQTESLASGFTQNELVASLNSLVTAGTNVGDAMKIMDVAEETAIAHHMQLTEVTQLLLEAEAGRGQGLARLDPQIRQMIQNHDTLSQILEVLHKQNQDQIDDGTSLERAHAREQAAMQAASETIGSQLLPALTYLAEAMIGAIQVAGDFGKAIGTGISGTAMLFVDSAMAMVHGAEAVGDALKGDFKDGAMQVSEALKSLQADGNDLKNATVGWVEPLAKGMADLAHMHQIGHQSVNEAVYLHDQATQNLSLQNDPTLGLGRQGAGSDYIAPPTQANEEREDLTSLTGALTEMDTAQKAVAAGQKELGASFSQSASSVTDAATAAQKLHQGYEQSQQDIARLVPLVKQEQTADASAREAVEQKYQAYQQTTSALSALQQSLSGKNKLTTAEKDALKEATDAQKTAEDAYKNADAALKQTNDTLKAHVTALDDAIKKSQAFVDAQNKMIASFNDAEQKARDSVQQELQTYDLSIAQQKQYWAAKLAANEAANQAYYDQNGYYDAALLKQEQDSYAKLLDVQTKAIEQQREDQKKILDQESTDVADFLDDLITKNDGFAAAFKSIWDNIVKAFAEDIAKMIVQSQLFQGALGGLGGASGGILSSLFGGGSGSSAESLIGTPGSPATQALQVNVAGVATDATSGIATGGGGAALSLGPLAALVGAAGLGGAIGSAEGDAPGNHNAAIGSVLGVGAAGMAFGSMGGIAGLIAAGPAGWAVLAGGAILGGALGGLFGSHTNPHDSPDIYDTSNYGQGMADLLGAGEGGSPVYTANGQQFSEDSSLTSQIGNQGEVAFISQWIANNPQEAQSVLSSQQLQYFTGATGGGYYQANGNVQLAGNDQTAYWSDLTTAAQSATQSILALGNAAGGATGPLVTITRTYPDFNIANLSAPTTSTSATTTTTGSSSTTGTAGTGGGTTIGNPTTVHLDFSGATIVGAGGMANVAQELSTALQQLQNGQLPGSSLLSVTQRLSMKMA